MKLTLDKDTILEHLSLATKFSSGRNTALSSLQGVLLHLKDQTIHLYTTNLNVFFHSKIKTDAEDEAKVVLEPRRIIEFLSLLNTGDTIFEIKDQSIVITQGKTKGTFGIMEMQDFPTPPAMEDGEMNVKTEIFRQYVPFVQFAASRDETRPALTAVNFVVQDDGLMLVATDGFRLSLAKIKEKVPFESMLLPGDFLSEVIRLIKKEKTVGFSASTKEKAVRFTIGDVELYSRLIDGDFPPFEKVIPASFETSVVFDREEMIRNVKLVSVFARDFSNIVIFDIQKGGIQVKPKTDQEDQMGSFQDAQIKGEPVKIAFNYKFVLDYLQHVASKEITLELLRSDAPAVFKEDKAVDAFHIIMPVRIQT
ncbi:DNA polymerase III subunit beta [Candidatus Microgenomates bacterium]|nr:DNA polymerase III subunit beta [Candidatus Microgenomates bacterium]